jgi:hypothetical protein
MGNNADIVMGATAVLVPPSPGFLMAQSDQAQPPSVALALPIRKATLNARNVPKARTGAGVKKTQPKSTSAIRKLADRSAIPAGTTSKERDQKIFRFMDLPGGKLSFFNSSCKR